jgi:hypothetical protein
MYFKPLLFPLMAQVLLTFIVLYIMGRKRVNEIKRNRINPQSTNTRQNSRAVFKDSAAASDNYHNQLESPLLFYVAILLTLMLMIQDYVIVLLAWTWVASRYVHAFIHITYNNVLHRFAVFVISSLVLFAIWFRLGWILIQ